MWPMLLLTLYCLVIVLSSLAGGLLLSLLRMTHTLMQLTMSFVGGLMLGVAVLHLLPHSIQMSANLDSSMFWMLCGLLLMFLLIRFFHVHQHGVGEPGHGHGEQGHADHHTHEHDHDHTLSHTHEHPQSSNLSWLAMAFGLALHTLFDGVALGSAVAVDFENTPGTWLAGLSAFVAIVLHKPLDSLALSAVMSKNGLSPMRQWGVNLAYAGMCPLGVAIVYLLRETSPQAAQQMVVGAALAFSAGVFICIALADVLPEVSFHSHDRLALTVALVLGVMLAYFIGYLEPPHTMPVGGR